MKKKHNILLIGLILLGLVFGFACYYFGQKTDKCSAFDRAKNNCVPAGRCTRAGDPRESNVDCVLKNYDHKFKQ